MSEWCESVWAFVFQPNHPTDVEPTTCGCPKKKGQRTRVIHEQRDYGWLEFWSFGHFRAGKLVRLCVCCHVRGDRRWMSARKLNNYYEKTADRDLLD